jgi:DNA polymerase alpha subunit B
MTADGDETGPVQLAARPDLILIPSKLKACTKQVGSTVCVNPGYLAKGKSGGTFARIVVHPFCIEETEDPGLVLEHSMPGRTRVEVVRI